MIEITITINSDGAATQTVRDGATDAPKHPAKPGLLKPAAKKRSEAARQYRRAISRAALRSSLDIAIAAGREALTLLYAMEQLVIQAGGTISRRDRELLQRDYSEKAAAVARWLAPFEAWRLLLHGPAAATGLIVSADDDLTQAAAELARAKVRSAIGAIAIALADLEKAAGRMAREIERALAIRRPAAPPGGKPISTAHALTFAAGIARQLGETDLSIANQEPALCARILSEAPTADRGSSEPISEVSGQ